MKDNIKEKAAYIFYSLKLKCVYRGKTKQNIYDVCIVLAKLNKKPSDLKYVDDISDAFQGRIPHNIIHGLRRIRPDLHSKIAYKIRHRQISKIAHYLAEDDGNQQDHVYYWLKAEKIRKALFNW